MRENHAELPAPTKSIGAAPKIALAIIGCEIVGALAAPWSASGIRAWLPTLLLPPWTPPIAAFGPLQIIFYALMGAAVGVIWAASPRGSSRTSREKRAVICFVVYLVLSVAWSAIFFGLHFAGGAYGIVIMLWLSSAATLWLFSKISRAAGWLMAFCLLWTTFLSTFNFAVLSLNYLKPAVQQMDNDKRNGPADSKPGATLR